jgi:hypothetical protein
VSRPPFHSPGAGRRARFVAFGIDACEELRAEVAGRVLVNETTFDGPDERADLVLGDEAVQLFRSWVNGSSGVSQRTARVSWWL